VQNRFQTKLKVFEGRPDLTPLIDVVFLLLIFFMLSSSFVQVSGIPVVLPEATASSDMSVDKLVVSIDKKNNLYFNDEIMDWESLTEQLQKCKLQWNADTVIVRADKNTKYGVVVKMMSLARSLELNVYVATVSTENPKEKEFKDATPE
jgi:biopolymer transport protein ExbD